MKGRLATWVATRRYTSGKEEGMVNGIVLMEDRFVYVILRPVATNIFPLNSLRHPPSYSKGLVIASCRKVFAQKRNAER